MNRGLINAWIDRCGIDVDPIKLRQDVRLVLDGDPADLNRLLARVRQGCFVSKQQECTGL